MTQIKLYYFDARGRGEAIRQLLALAKVQFEDVRITHDTWPTYKDQTPFGQVPVLEVNGTKIAQANAILRYVGHQYGFAGANNLENALIDQVAELITDAQAAPGINEWPLVCLGIVNADKVVFFKEKVRSPLNKFAGLYEKFLVENGRSHLLLEKVTWVDVLAAEFFSRFLEFGEHDALEAFPHVMELIDRVHNLPEIKKHIGARKTTLF